MRHFKERFMMQTVMKSCLGLVVALALATGIFAKAADATSIGTLSAGSSFSDTIQSKGPTIGNDYSFHLDSSATGLTILATAIGQTAGTFGIDDLKIQLFDAANNLIAFATGTTLAGLDSFNQSGVALGA